MTTLINPDVDRVVLRRFCEKIAIPADLTDLTADWLWLGARSGRGYGVVTIDGVRRPAHRVAYEMFVGPILPGLLVKHGYGCTTRACVRPHHLVAITPADHPRANGLAFGVDGFCRSGRHHAIDEWNVLIRPDGTRLCRPCSNEQRRQHRRAG